MLSHVPGLQTYNSKQPFSLVNGVAVQIYRQASKLTTSPGSLRLHIEITCDYITLQIYMRPAKRWGWKSQGSPFERFAWPCVFSSPAIYFLPAERDYRDISDFFAFKGETIYAVLTWFRIVFPNSPLFLSIQP